MAYVEALNNETAITLCEFFERARLWFRSVGVAVDEILTNNGANELPPFFCGEVGCGFLFVVVFVFYGWGHCDCVVKFLGVVSGVYS